MKTIILKLVTENEAANYNNKCLEDFLQTAECEVFCWDMKESNKQEIKWFNKIHKERDEELDEE